MRPRIKLGISLCLLGEPVRWDGGRLALPFLENLKEILPPDTLDR